MTTIRCQAMLFDMDGVLVFSMGAVERVWSKWAVAHGFDPNVVVHAAHGRPSIETVREFLPHGDSHAENLQIERGEIEDLEGVVAVPGALALVNSLPADRWIVATSATLALAEVRLRAASIPVLHNMITSGDIQRGKPDPEPYLKAAARLGFPASECVVVEDAIAGVRSGKAAGARVIAMLTSSERVELERAGADWVVRDCTDIVANFDGSSLILTLTV